MKLLNTLSSLPEKVYIGAFVLIIILTASYAYIMSGDTIALEQKIVSRQKDLNGIVKLKDLYLAKKKNFEHATAKKTEKNKPSLTLLEEVVSKTFVGGRLTLLKPSTMKDEKGKSLGIYELKFGGAALGEVVNFVKEVESAGLYVKKLQMNMPAAGQTLIDMYAVITEGS